MLRVVKGGPGFIWDPGHTEYPLTKVFPRISLLKARFSSGCLSGHEGIEWNLIEKIVESQWLAAASWELADATVWAQSLLCQRDTQWLQNTCVPLSAVTPLDKALPGDEHGLSVTSSLVTDFASSVLLLIGLLTGLHTVPWPLFCSHIMYQGWNYHWGHQGHVHGFFYCMSISIFQSIMKFFLMTV